jgi:hypothetical protein
VRLKVATKEKSTPPAATVYQCVVCKSMKQVEEGKKVGIYLKETLGTANGFICPQCEAIRK